MGSGHILQPPTKRVCKTSNKLNYGSLILAMPFPARGFDSKEDQTLPACRWRSWKRARRLHSFTSSERPPSTLGGNRLGVIICNEINKNQRWQKYKIKANTSLLNARNRNDATTYNSLPIQSKEAHTSSRDTRSTCSPRLMERIVTRALSAFKKKKLKKISAT